MYEVVRYSDVNVIGTAILLEELQARRGQIKRIVVASSRSIYGEGRYSCTLHGDVFPKGRRTDDMAAGQFEPRCSQCGSFVSPASTHEDNMLNPQSIYAVTKLAQENMVLAAAQANGMTAYALRYQNVYGPGQSLNNPYTGILSIFSREFLAGRSVEIFEDGLESRDFVHVDDVADVNVLALSRQGNVCATINVGSGKAISVNDVAVKLQKILGNSDQCLTSGRFRAGDIRHNFAYISRLQALLGYTPSTTFDAGMAQFCEWAVSMLASADGNAGYRNSLNELEQRGLINSAEA